MAGGGKVHAAVRGDGRSGAMASNLRDASAPGRGAHVGGPRWRERRAPAAPEADGGLAGGPSEDPVRLMDFVSDALGALLRSAGRARVP